jgi:hypothetical protein
MVMHAPDGLDTGLEQPSWNGHRIFFKDLGKAGAGIWAAAWVFICESPFYADVFV